MADCSGISGRFHRNPHYYGCGILCLSYSKLLKRALKWVIGLTSSCISIERPTLRIQVNLVTNRYRIRGGNIGKFALTNTTSKAFNMHKNVAFELNVPSYCIKP